MRLSLIAASIAALGVTAAHADTIAVTYDGGGGVTGDLNVTETPFGTGALYGVDNSTTGSLFGFGVTNPGGQAAIFEDGINSGGFGCTSGANLTFGLICYDADTLGEAAWTTQDVIDAEIPIIDSDLSEFVSLTFEDLFGDFDTVVGAGNVFHWYTAVDGDMQAGDSVDGFFGFEESVVASSVFGISTGGNGFTAFTAGNATVVGQPSTVPLPAGAVLMLSALGMGALLRRKAA